MFLNTEEVHVYHESGFLQSIKSVIGKIGKGTDKSLNNVSKNINPLHNNSYNEIMEEISDDYKKADEVKDYMNVYKRVRLEIQSAHAVKKVLDEKIEKTAINADYKKLLVAVDRFISKLKVYEDKCNKKLQQKSKS